MHLYEKYLQWDINTYNILPKGLSWKDEFLTSKVETILLQKEFVPSGSIFVSFKSRELGTKSFL